VPRRGSSGVCTVGHAGRIRRGHAPHLRTKRELPRQRPGASDALLRSIGRSTIKTLTKRLEAAVNAGDTDLIAAEHLALVRLIDRSASNGSIHKNTAGRKKAQAARLVATTSVAA
jgi:ribosomal protein S20